MDELIDFKLEAIKKTYAGYAEPCGASRPGSNDYTYTKGDYQYYDTWLGGEKFSGGRSYLEKGKSNLFDELFWKKLRREI